MAKKKTSIRILSEGELRRKYGASSSKLALDVESQLWLPSRILALNNHLGGGILYGTILELFGYESTGKSLLASDFAVATQKLGGKVLWADTEFSVRAEWFIKQGIDPKLIELMDENNSVEYLSDWVLDMILYWRNKLTNNEPILLVVDSVANLDCEENIGAKAQGASGQMGNRAKAIYRMFRERSSFLKHLGICSIFINQVRSKLGTQNLYKDAETTPGGMALKFYAHQRVALVRSQQIKGKLVKGIFKENKLKGKKVGQNVIIKTMKNKVAPPGSPLYAKVYFTDYATGDVGFDRYCGLDALLLEKRIVKKGGSWYKYKGNNIAQGEAQFLNLLINDKKLRKEMLEGINVNTINTLKSKLSSLGRNLYPVNIKSLASLQQSNDGQDE